MSTTRSSSSSSKKRALVITEQDNDGAPPARRMRPLESIYQAHVQSELEDLKAALEHERSLRTLDQRRAKQTQARLERQVQFAVEEGQEVKSLLEDLREESEVHVAQLREARADALMQLRECQAQLAQAELDIAEEHDAVLAREKLNVLQEQLEFKTQEVEALRERLAEVTKEKLSSLSSEMLKTPTKSDMSAEGEESPAPKEILRELNKVRIEKAESERKHRQLRRKADEWQQRANLYVQEREANRVMST